MKISELHRQLEMIAQAHGDIDVIYADSGFLIKPDHELFARFDEIRVERNSALTRYDFQNMDVAVIRSYDD